ncbi:MAG: type III pantothenate kinase [Chthoniobacterales bacterium]
MISRYLLIDISNSFTKATTSDGSLLGEILRIETKKLNTNYLEENFSARRFSDLQGVILSSVVPAQQKIIRNFAEARSLSLQEISARRALGIGIDYPKPEQIGADRLANAVAVDALYGSPAIVVDFGTAVTFDVMSSGREYLGGVIAPGLRAMTSYLHESTALLPKIELQEPKSVIGKSTRQAMLSGAVFGYSGLIQEIVTRIREEAFGDSKIQIVATGGDAEIIVRHCPIFTAVNKNLTLQGLRVLAKRFFSG